MLYDIEVRIDNEYFSDGIIDFNTEKFYLTKHLKMLVLMHKY